MEAIIIRTAGRDDFEAIHGFINLLEDEAFDEDSQRRIYLENIANPDNIYLLAFARTIAVGFLSCHTQNLLHHGGRIGEIQEMFVSENARSHGVGRRLIERLVEIAQANDVLQLEVTSSFRREDAHRFYQREGFVHTHKKFTLKL